MVISWFIGVTAGVYFENRATIVVNICLYTIDLKLYHKNTHYFKKEKVIQIPEIRQVDMDGFDQQSQSSGYWSSASSVDSNASIEVNVDLDLDYQNI